jgi:hypothetical protein
VGPNGKPFQTILRNSLVTSICSRNWILRT